MNPVTFAHNPVSKVLSMALASASALRSTLFALFVTAAIGPVASGCASDADDGDDLGSDESDLKVALGTSHNGKTVSAKAGNKIVIKLPGLGTAGYQWNVVSSGSLKAPSKRTIAPSSGSGAGASAAEEFTWSTKGAKGTITLRLEQKRAWEATPINTYTVHLKFPGTATKQACAAAGGTCVGLAPGNCEDGTIGDATLYDCGTGVGVMCCLP